MSRYCPYKNTQALYLECKECKNPICTEDTFFCLVVGSRSFHDYSQLSQKLDFLLQKQRHVVIVSGGAKGADALAEQYANDKGYPMIIMRADWEKFGRKAGYLRNQQMQEFLAKQAHRGVVAFWDGTSKGTSHHFQLSTTYHNPIKVILFAKK